MSIKIVNWWTCTKHLTVMARNKKPKVYTVFDRRKESAKTGKGKVEVVVNLSGTQFKYIPVGACAPEEYEKYITKKAVVEELVKARQTYDKLLELDEELTIANFNFHAGIKETHHMTKEERKAKERRGSFVTFIKEALAKEKVGEATRKRKLRLIKILEESGLMKTFNDIIVPNVYKLEDYLQQPYYIKRGKNVRKVVRDQTTIFAYHKIVHQYATRAWHFGIIDVDPYNLIKLDHGSYRKRTPLTEEELERICALTDLNASLLTARDLFVFAAYTGLSYIDTQTFDYEAFVEQHGGMFFINTDRGKTGVPYYTPILQPAMDVLVRHNYKLPKMSNQKINGYLKIIAEMAKITKNLTFHLARHTFATLALAHDIPLENVSKMLGHTNTKTTQIYAKVLHTTVERHASELAEKIKDVKVSMPDHKVAFALDMTTKEPEHKKVNKRDDEHSNGKRSENEASQTANSSTPGIGYPVDNSASGFGFNITGYYTMW